MDISMKEYINLTTKIIRSVANFSVADKIINDQDIFGEMVGEVMHADYNWDGRGNIYGYRKQRIIWAILKYLNKKKSNTTVSLNHIICDGKELQDFMISGDITPLENIEKKELKNIVNDILNLSMLSDNQRRCIFLKYLKSMTLRQISVELQISSEAVRQNIFNGINKLKKMSYEHKKRFGVG